MNITDLCRSRRLSSDLIRTPLLVPSFSSRGFPFFREIYKTLARYVSRACLVSAFDIANGYVSPDDLYASDILFVDSGGYEVKPSYDPLEAYHDQRVGTGWSLGMYEGVLSELRPNSEIVIVSYDGAEELPLREQLDGAAALFAQYPFPGDFLWKPEPGSQYCGDPADLVKCLAGMDVVRCLGVTDNELGASLVDRCRGIARLREDLGQAGIELPIHVFGCLDPLSCVLFFLCGADVFDGLSWLRYAYIDNAATYMQQAPIVAAEGELSDEDVALSCWVENLGMLDRVQRSMAEFSMSLDVNNLLLSPRERQSLRVVLRKADISTEGVI